MKKIILLLSVGLLFSLQALASDKCFLLQENNKILKEEGNCSKRYGPQSSFKIALSLMGYDAGILEDATHPNWPFKEGYDLFINVCKGAHNPHAWMRDSCVWYSRVLTQKLGMEKFKNYVTKFNYGNMDVSGDRGKNNGLTNSWISSSLEISPSEQAEFLQKLIDKKFPVSEKAIEMTKKILFREELPGGWMMYGKTGNGNVLNSDRSANPDLQQGWFVGWIEKNDRKIIFVSHLADDKTQDIFASFRTRDEARNKLWYFINDLEK
jgi:beta-lactamase class D